MLCANIPTAAGEAGRRGGPEKKKSHLVESERHGRLDYYGAARLPRQQTLPVSLPPEEGCFGAVLGDLI